MKKYDKTVKTVNHSIPVIFPGAVVGLYSCVVDSVDEVFDKPGVFFEPLPALFESIPECWLPGVSLPDGEALVGGEVTLWCEGEITLLPGEVILSGGDEARGVPVLDLGVPDLRGVPALPDLSFKLPRFGVLAVPLTGNKSASRSSRSWNDEQHTNNYISFQKKFRFGTSGKINQVPIRIISLLGIRNILSTNLPNTI